MGDSSARPKPDMLVKLAEKQMQRVPSARPFYAFNKGHWDVVESKEPLQSTESSQNPYSSEFCLITWNIDFMAPLAEERMQSAVDYLKTIVADDHKTMPVVIFLQEMTEEDISTLKATDWIRTGFYCTEITTETWSAAYGTVTLVNRRLDLLQTATLQFVSEYGRHGLFADVKVTICQPSSDRLGMTGATEALESQGTLRLCNVHLDSMAGNPPLRPIQVQAVARELKHTTVYAGLVAGDMNANSVYDRNLHTENDLSDAYLALGGNEQDPEGHTWGYQNDHNTRFPPNRLDKVFYCGKVKAKSLQRIGVNVNVEDPSIIKSHGDVWVTDHYGLKAIMSLQGDGKLVFKENSF